MPGGVLNGARLKCCEIERRMLTLEQVNKRLDAKGYQLVGEYLGTDKRILVRCNRHGDAHEVMARGLLSKNKNLPCCGNESIRERMTGRVVTDEFKEKCRVLQQGDKSYWHGKTLTKDHRQKISASGAKAFSESIDRHIEHAKRGVTAGKPGHFYIFKVGELLKFGSVSRMTPEQRMAKIRRDTGLECEIVMTAKVDDAGAYEAAMMDRYRGHWARHEYFHQSVLAS